MKAMNRKLNIRYHFSSKYISLLYSLGARGAVDVNNIVTHGCKWAALNTM